MSGLNVIVQRNNYSTNWRDRFKVASISINEVEPHIKIKDRYESIFYQIGFHSKESVPETSVYFEGNDWALRDLVNDMYNTMQLEIKCETPTNWPLYRKRQYLPSVELKECGIQCYRCGLGRRSYFICKRILVSPDIPVLDKPIMSRIDFHNNARGGGYPISIYGSKVDVFSLCSSLYLAIGEFRTVEDFSPESFLRTGPIITEIDISF